MIGGALLAALMAAGVTVTTGGEQCRKPGWRGYFLPGRVVLCEMSREILRHEAVHAAQHCVGWRPLMPPAWSWQQATIRDRFLVGTRYAGDLRTKELEARVIARRYSDEQVASIVRHYCGGEGGGRYPDPSERLPAV